MKQIANDDRQEVGTGWDGRDDTVGTTSPAVALHTVLSFEGNQIGVNKTTGDQIQ